MKTRTAETILSASEEFGRLAVSHGAENDVTVVFGSWDHLLQSVASAAIEVGPTGSVQQELFISDLKFVTVNVLGPDAIELK